MMRQWQWRSDREGSFCLIALLKCNWSETNGTYLKYAIWKVSTYMYIHEAITIVEIMSISIMPKSFLVPLGGGGRLFRYSFFSGKFVWKGDIWIEWQEREFQAGRGHTYRGAETWMNECVSGAERSLLLLECTVRGGKWQNPVGPRKPEWEFGCYSKHTGESLEGTL